MIVKSVKYDSLQKTFRLENGQRFVAHRYSCVGPGDNLVVVAPSRAHVRCSNGNAQILPIYMARDSLTIGLRKVNLKVKEISTEQELDAYHQLENCHYRGKALHGRRVPLIVTTSDPLLPEVLGYIEIATTFIMNRPRAVLLDAPFADEKGKISWNGWKKDAAKKYTNLVVRIARAVVSPEFRGLGLASVLVKHAAVFAKKHWQVGNLKPLFIEITADMLRYVPFVESAGMHYIGDTEGNVERVWKDMDYILGNYSRVRSGKILQNPGAGIIDLQLSYATLLKKIQRVHRVPRDKLLALLLRQPQRLSDDNWNMLHRIFRLPKPTFVMGLTRGAKAFVRNRCRQLALPRKYPTVQPKGGLLPRLSGPIEVRSCSLTLSGPLIRTRATRKIQQAFGVSRDMLSTTVFAKLGFTIRPGEVILICGPSGAGKTSLLSMLTKKLENSGVLIPGLKGEVGVPPRSTIASLGPLSRRRPLVNSLGQKVFEHALFALNVSGLAEPHLYVKRFNELSNGQRYRAMVAKLIASEVDVWAADEFCATLDPITSNIVARNLRRCAKALGVTVILAAANWSEFIHELRPDVIVHLRAPWDYRVFRWKSFRRALAQSPALGDDT